MPSNSCCRWRRVSASSAPNGGMAHWRHIVGVFAEAERASDTGLR
jgi:hypothetical protein